MIDATGETARHLRALLDLGAIGGLSDGGIARSLRPGAQERGRIFAFEALVGRHGGNMSWRPAAGSSAIPTTRTTPSRPRSSNAGQPGQVDPEGATRSARGSTGSPSGSPPTPGRARARRGDPRAERRASRRGPGRRPRAPSSCPGRFAEELARLPDRFRAAVDPLRPRRAEPRGGRQAAGLPRRHDQEPAGPGSRPAAGGRSPGGGSPRRSSPWAWRRSPRPGRRSCPPRSAKSHDLRAGSRVALGGPTAGVGVGSAAVAALVEGTIKAMTWTRIRWAAGALLLIGTGSIGVGIANQAATVDPPQAPPPAPAPRAVVLEGSERRALREAFRDRRT